MCRTKPRTQPGDNNSLVSRPGLPPTSAVIFRVVLFLKCASLFLRGLLTEQDKHEGLASTKTLQSELASAERNLAEAEEELVGLRLRTSELEDVRARQVARVHVPKLRYKLEAFLLLLFCAPCLTPRTSSCPRYLCSTLPQSSRFEIRRSCSSS